MNKQSPISRRQAISGIGTGLVAVAAPRIFAAERSSQQESALSGKLQDPTSKYPKPPFNGQSQPWPGLASKMDPRPDHGEESYKGSGRLMGRKALITGGDSGMGRAAAIAYAREGADVAINYFPTEESDAQEVIALIRAEGRKAIALPGDLREEAFCQKLVADAVNGLDGLDILVSNAGRQQSQFLYSRYFDRAVRLDDQDQHLCPLLDHQGGPAAFTAGIGNHRDHFRAGLRPVT